jgi:hypothetical protein
MLGTVLDMDGYALLPLERKQALNQFVDVAFGGGITHRQCFRLEVTEAGCVGYFYAERDGKFYCEGDEVVSFAARTFALPPDWRRA